MALVLLKMLVGRFALGSPLTTSIVVSVTCAHHKLSIIFDYFEIDSVFVDNPGFHP